MPTCAAISFLWPKKSWAKKYLGIKWPCAAHWNQNAIMSCQMAWQVCENLDMPCMVGGENVAVPKQSTRNHGLSAKQAFGNDVITPRPDLIRTTLSWKERNWIKHTYTKRHSSIISFFPASFEIRRVSIYLLPNWRRLKQKVFHYSYIMI